MLCVEEPVGKAMSVQLSGVNGTDDDPDGRFVRTGELSVELGVDETADEINDDKLLPTEEAAPVLLYPDRGAEEIAEDVLLVMLDKIGPKGVAEAVLVNVASTEVRLL